MFESITLYDNTLTEATYIALADGRYDVTLKWRTFKYVSDGLGKEKPITPGDYITFGVFNEEGEEIWQGKWYIDSNKGVLNIIVDDKPASAGIDPYYYLIDKHSDDNKINFSED